MRVLVGLFILLFICGAWCDCPSKRSGLVKWSTTSTWGGVLPGTDQNISIPEGKSVLVDINVTAGEVYIPATSSLIFDDTKDLYFNTTAIRVAGQLWIGSSDCPYTHNLEIVLFGEKSDDTAIAYGYKVIAGIPGSTVEIHGSFSGPTWVRLAATAKVNDTSITVDTPVQGWKVGDVIVIASTDYDELQTERRSIISIDSTMKVIGLNDTLKYMHWGVNGIVDERAEVALLTRNIKIHGDLTTNTSLTQGFGGHIMLQGDLTAHLSYIEVFNMGQKGVLGRYPIHFHLGKEDGLGNSLVGASIHDNFQRCLTIHWTDNLLVTDNVAYYTNGHCYFFENGAEYNNTLINNIGMVARPVAAGQGQLIATDTEPSIFWITHPSNTWIGNVAVGGKFGYWFTMPVHPIGPANTADNNITIFPMYSPIILFKGNKAHSQTEDGLFGDRGVQPDNTATVLSSASPKLWKIDLNNLPNATNYDYGSFISGQAQVAPNYIIDFTAYKCHDHGVWLRGSDWIVQNARIADCLVGVNMPGNNAVKDSIMIGETDNIGNPTNLVNQGYRTRPSATATIWGFQNYDAGGPDYVLNNTFINYIDYTYVNGTYNGKVRKSGGIGGIHGPNVLSARHRYYGSKFINVTNNVYLEKPTGSPVTEDSMQGEVLYDAGGELTGVCGSRIVVNSPDMYTDDCTWKDSWNLWVCPPASQHHPMFTIKEVAGTVYNYTNDYVYTFNGTVAGAAMLYRLPDGNNRSLIVGYISGVSGVYTKSYQSHVLGNTEYAIAMPFPTPVWLQVTIAEIPKGNWMVLAIPYPSGSTFIVSTDSAQKTRLTQVFSKSDLNSTTYYFDDSAGYLWIQLLITADSFGYQYNIFYPYYSTSANIYINATCPAGVCQKPSYEFNSALLGKSVKTGSRVGDPCEANTIMMQQYNKFTQIGTDYAIFDDQLANNWTFTGLAAGKYNFTKDQAISGYSMNASLAAYNTLSFRNSKGGVWIQSVNGGSKLYFEYSIFTSGMTGVPNPAITQQNKNITDFRVTLYATVNNTYVALGSSLPANNPFYIDSFPLSPNSWKTLRYPLSDLVTTDYNASITRIDIASQNNFPMSIYMDSVRFVAYNVATVLPTSAPTNAPTTAATDSPVATTGPNNEGSTSPASTVTCTILVVLYAMLVVVL